jgi:hypothetical protein
VKLALAILVAAIAGILTGELLRYCGPRQAPVSMPTYQVGDGGREAAAEQQYAIEGESAEARR